MAKLGIKEGIGLIRVKTPVVMQVEASRVIPTLVTWKEGRQ
jgi:hypothetical protein